MKFCGRGQIQPEIQMVESIEARKADISGVSRLKFYALVGRDVAVSLLILLDIYGTYVCGKSASLQLDLHQSGSLKRRYVNSNS